MRNSKKMAVFAAGALVLSMITGSAALAAENAYSIDMTDLNNEAWEHVAMTNDDTVTTGVCVRSASGENGEIVGFLYRGGAVTVLNKGAQWTEIESGNVKGYVKNEYLTYGTDAKGLAEHYGDYGVKASWNDVNIFAWDDKDADVIGTANDGDTYSIVSNNGHWIEVSTGDKDTAFVSEEDVDLVILVDTAVSLNEEKESRTAGTPASGKTEETVDTAVYEAPASAPQESTQSVSYTENASYTETPAVTEQAAPAQETAQPAEVAVTLSAQVSETTQDQAAAYETAASDEAEQTSDDAYADTGYEENGDDAAQDLEYQDGTYEDIADDSTEYAEEEVTYQDGADVEDGSEEDAYSEDGSEETYTDDGSEEDYSDDSYTDDTGEEDAETYNDDEGTGDDASEASYEEDSYSEDTYEDTYSEDTYTEDTYSEDTYTEDSYSEDTYTEDTCSEDTSSQDSSGSSSASDTDLLAAIIYCEAGNQPFDGMVAVGAVVMNRVASSSFPNTISEVIYQSGQFTPAYSGSLASALANGVPSGCYDAAGAALSGQDPTGGCLYFNTSHGSGVLIGAHWFY